METTSYEQTFFQ